MFCLLHSNASEKGYKINVQIRGISDTVCYLANYYGDKTYLTDTAFVKAKGKFVFEGDSTLPGGVYIIAGQSNNRYFEVIIDREQHFTLETDLDDIMNRIKFTNSDDNIYFYNYISNNISNHKKIESLKQRKTELSEYPDSVQSINQQIVDINIGIKEYQQQIINQYPESFVSVLLNAMKEPEIGEVPILENGREDSVYAYQYFKNHYWDYFDLTDERLLRTPLFHKRLERYFTSVIYQEPDTITKEADLIINKARTNKEVFKYIVWYLTYKFETSKIMGFDEIFVHMVDTYYSTGQAYWSDSTVVRSLSKRADALRPILIGKKAPELILIDTAGSFVSLYYSPARYMILIFYETDCGHCRKEIDSMKVWYDNNDFGVGVFAICTDTSLVKWKKFIVEKDLNWINVNGTRSVTQDYHDLYDVNMTPTIFLLDEKKKIIAKRLKMEQLIPFIENYEKYMISDGENESLNN
ncbi:MAG: DUF5106 domain-containing protein [Bacteroidales bacterium]